MQNPILEMPDRTQKTITLSPKVLEDFERVAAHLGKPLSSYLRDILEQHYRSSEFGELLDRVKMDDRPLQINEE